VSDATAAEAPVADAPPIPDGVSIANHPRARVWIRRTRARVALTVFVLVLLLCLHSDVPGQAAVGRALVGGVAGYLVAWAASLVLWRHIVMAELHAAYVKREHRRRALLEAQAAREAARREAIEHERAARNAALGG
jgi:uncharacterized membrane protein